MYMFCIHVGLIVSSPYLLVFGDDCIRGTREHRMLQVDLVRHRAGVGLVWQKSFIGVLSIYSWNNFVNSCY